MFSVKELTFGMEGFFPKAQGDLRSRGICFFTSLVTKGGG